jgi:DNA repair exonuclease SbcCD ATPase subunit
MLKKIKEWFHLERSLEEKKRLLIELEQTLNQKEQLVESIKLEAKVAIQSELDVLEQQRVVADSKLSETMDNLSSIEKKVTKLTNAAKKFKTDSVGIKTLIDKFPDAVNYDLIAEELSILESALGEGVLETLVQLNLHHQDSKLLKKEMTANNREITKLLKAYEGRYNTKANKTIYHLMVIGLKAELQNILHKLKYTNLSQMESEAKALIDKYLTICGEGNASILPTITKFLTEIEPLFYNAIQIEYKYYVQKEKEKEEQRLIREQMKLEAEERRILEEEKKKLEKEAEKYQQELFKNRELLEKEDDPEKRMALAERLEELTQQVNQLEEQKEEIVKRANGRAGYVYVISNLGSFGDQMFKVGMTRRLNPQDRIDELGNASVPFRFDIHAMVFSDNAVGLEQAIHERLASKRVNKINLRKEFFYADVASLQELVQDIDPTVEFTTTLLAEEYRQSKSIQEEALHVV